MHPPCRGACRLHIDCAREPVAQTAGCCNPQRFRKAPNDNGRRYRYRRPLRLIWEVLCHKGNSFPFLASGSPAASRGTSSVHQSSFRSYPAMLPILLSKAALDDPGNHRVSSTTFSFRRTNCLSISTIRHSRFLRQKSPFPVLFRFEAFLPDDLKLSRKPSRTNRKIATYPQPAAFAVDNMENKFWIATARIRIRPPRGA